MYIFDHSVRVAYICAVKKVTLFWGACSINRHDA